MTSKYAGRGRAPEFPEGAEWVNARRAPRVGDFAGRLLILAFWSLRRISCVHLVSTLRRLEREFGEEIAVVGAHSSRFEGGRSTESVRRAVERCGVRHPVVNDAGLEAWNAYGARTRPTLAFVDPEGRLIGRFEGELTYEQGVDLISEMLGEFRERGLLRRGFSGVEVAPEEPRLGMLRYPGNVLADAAGERLFIADSGHNRALVVAPDGEIQTVIGSGREGMADGALEWAEFRNPQGLAIAGEALYIADTGNHSIRVADLEAGTVDTIAGTGAAGMGRTDGGPALLASLRSPWGLVVVGRRLYATMAGSCQLWMYDMDSGVIQAVAGTGAEGLVDGAPEGALLAQPSGIDADEDGALFFADSESSAIRGADLATTHWVTTLVGAGLFEFGDRDGDASFARMQHPVGVAYEGGALYVADTYNHKIKRVGLQTLQVSTVAGTGEAGFSDGSFGSARFWEPGGLCVMDGKIYAADTNNHAVRALDFSSGRVSTLPVDF